MMKSQLAIAIVPAPAQASSLDPPSSDPLCLNGKAGDKEKQDDPSAVEQPVRLAASLKPGNSLLKGGTSRVGAMKGAFASQFEIAAQSAQQTMQMQAKMKVSPDSVRGKILTFVHGRFFNVTIAVAIAINVVFLGIETDLADLNDDKLDMWYYLEVGFTIVFCIELIFRLLADRCQYFNDHWNIFDFLLVVFSSVDNFVVEHVVHGSDKGQAVELVSIMRILRVARVARVIRLLRFFKKLWLLIIGVVSAMRTLVWALVLIVIVIFIFGMFLARALGSKSSDGDEYMDEEFGTVPRSMFTLFQVMTLEGWAGITRSSMKLRPWIWPVFFLFLMLTTFSILNVIVAVIVESTLEQADSHKTDTTKRTEAELRQAGDKVAKVFERSDTDGDGQITKEEFMEALQREDILVYLHEVGIDVRQAENLFDILDYDDSGSLDAKEFTSGVLKARGGALAKDVLAVQCEMWRYEMQVRCEIQQLCRNIDKRVARVNADIDVIHSDLHNLSCSLGLSALEADLADQAPELPERLSLGSSSMHSKDDLRFMEEPHAFAIQGSYEPARSPSLDSDVSLQELEGEFDAFDRRSFTSGTLDRTLSKTMETLDRTWDRTTSTSTTTKRIRASVFDS